VGCAECGSELREGARFCAVCGTAAGAAVAGRVGSAAESAGAVAAPPAPATERAPARQDRAAARERPSAPKSAAKPALKQHAPAQTQWSSAASGAGEWLSSVLLPAFPFRLAWSPRRPWGVTTGLTDAQVATVFEEVMTKGPGMFWRLNNYFRNVRWKVARNAMSGNVVATCVQTGPVSIGWGSSKWMVNADGDTVECHLNRPAPDARGEVLIAPGTYSTWFGLYLFPAPRYSLAVVKALRRADPTAQVRYPWSAVRIVALALVAVALFASAVSGDDSNATSASSDVGDVSQVAPPAETPDEALPAEDATTASGDDTASSEPPAADSSENGTGDEGSVDDELAVTDAESGRYVRLGSFRSQDNAQREADRIQGLGIAATVLDSSQTAGLLPAFFVVAVGPLDSAAQERRIIKRSGVNGALAGELGSAQEELSPTSLEGSFSGTVKQVDPKVERLNRDRSVSIGFEPGGESGTAAYEGPRCTSTLTLSGSDGPTLHYSEEILTGSCAAGTWSVKLEGSQLLATWWGLDRTTFRVGRLDRD
jgi:hypothetical protein